MAIEDKTRVVSQNSELGSSMLMALASKGVCGPNCNLSDLSVTVRKYGENFDYIFYDMSGTIFPEDKYYGRIAESFNSKK